MQASPDTYYQTNGGGSGNYGGGFDAGNPNSYGGTGGAVGGFSPSFAANLSGYTGVGSGVGYNRFTPQLTTSAPVDVLEPVTNNPISSAFPDWLKGIFTGIFNKLPVLLNFGNDGSSASANVAGHNYVGNVYTQNGNYYLNLNGDTSLITRTATGIETTNLTSPNNGFVDYLGGNSLSPTPTPTTSTTPTNTTTSAQSILDQLSSLLGSGTPSSASFQAPPNLYQFTPTNQTQGSTSMLPKILIIGAIIFGAYWMYKKYA